MNHFARVVLGYHGCHRDFRDELMTSDSSISPWRPSENDWDWLGHGIYFWEHAPARALRWAENKHGNHGAIVGAVIQLGVCLDLMDEHWTNILGMHYTTISNAYSATNDPMPTNAGKRRELDCLIINSAIEELAKNNAYAIQTVRGSFEEGVEAYPGAAFRRETHIQIAVRDVKCILGLFKPSVD